MSYATVNQLRAELADQVPAGAGIDSILQRKLDSATAIIDQEVGFSFGLANIESRIAVGDGTPYLIPPRFVAGSVTGVTAPSGITVPDYVEEDGVLVVVDAEGVLIRDWPTLQRTYGQLDTLRWQEGVPYIVAATFGWAGVPADIQEACIQLAVRMWRGRDAAFSDVVGVEGSGAVGYNGAFPNMVKRILANYRDSRSGLGVW